MKKNKKKLIQRTVCITSAALLAGSLAGTIILGTKSDGYRKDSKDYYNEYVENSNKFFGKLNEYAKTEEFKQFKEEKIAENKEKYEKGEISLEQYAKAVETWNSYDGVNFYVMQNKPKEESDIVWNYRVKMSEAQSSCEENEKLSDDYLNGAIACGLGIVATASTATITGFKGFRKEEEK